MIKDNKFGELLRKFRVDKKFTQNDLSTLLAYSRSTVARWELGETLPDRETIEWIAKSLELNQYEFNLLLLAGGYQSAEEVISIQSLPTNNYHERNPEDIQSYLEQLRTQARDINDAVHHLQQEAQSENTLPNSQNPLLDASKEFILVERNIADMSSTLNNLALKISMPNHFEIKLIESSALESLDEYRADLDQWVTWRGITLGAITGIIINLITGSSLNEVIFVILILLAVFFGLCQFKCNIQIQRINELKKKKFNYQTIT